MAQPEKNLFALLDDDAESDDLSTLIGKLNTKPVNPSSEKGEPKQKKHNQQYRQNHDSGRNYSGGNGVQQYENGNSRGHYGSNGFQKNYNGRNTGYQQSYDGRSGGYQQRYPDGAQGSRNYGGGSYDNRKNGNNGREVSRSDTSDQVKVESNGKDVENVSKGSENVEEDWTPVLHRARRVNSRANSINGEVNNGSDFKEEASSNGNDEAPANGNGVDNGNVAATIEDEETKKKREEFERKRENWLKKHEVYLARQKVREEEYLARQKVRKEEYEARQKVREARALEAAEEEKKKTLKQYQEELEKKRAARKEEVRKVTIDEDLKSMLVLEKKREALEAKKAAAERKVAIDSDDAESVKEDDAASTKKTPKKKGKTMGIEFFESAMPSGRDYRRGGGDWRGNQQEAAGPGNGGGPRRQDGGGPNNGGGPRRQGDFKKPAESEKYDENADRRRVGPGGNQRGGFAEDTATNGQEKQEEEKPVPKIGDMKEFPGLAREQPQA